MVIRALTVAGAVLLAFSSTLIGRDGAAPSPDWSLTMRSGLDGAPIHAAAFGAPTEGSATAVSTSKSELKRRRNNAFLKSLLIPGWGQFATGRKAAGSIFLSAEIGLLATAFGLRTYANWLEDDYQTLARQHAGVTDDQSHQFYVDIGNWQDRRSFNEQRLRYRQFDAMYLSDRQDWFWDSDANRLQFKDVRLSSDRARQDAVLAFGALALNHLIAGVEASRGVKKATMVYATADPTTGISLNLAFRR